MGALDRLRSPGLSVGPLVPHGVPLSRDMTSRKLSPCTMVVLHRPWIIGFCDEMVPVSGEPRRYPPVRDHAGRKRTRASSSLIPTPSYGTGSSSGKGIPGYQVSFDTWYQQQGYLSSPRPAPCSTYEVPGAGPAAIARPSHPRVSFACSLPSEGILPDDHHPLLPGMKRMGIEMYPWASL